MPKRSGWAGRMIRDDFEVMIIGAFHGAQALKNRMRNLKMKRAMTPGGGVNEQILFGTLPNGRGELEDSDPILYDFVVAAAEWITDRLQWQMSKRDFDSVLLRSWNQPPGALLGGSMFTTGVIHKNYSGGYHKDSGATEGTLVASLVLWDGAKTSGGEILTLTSAGMYDPEDGEVFAFNGCKIEHRVLPARGADRYSVIFTSRTGLTARPR